MWPLVECKNGKMMKSILFNQQNNNIHVILLCCYISCYRYYAFSFIFWQPHFPNIFLQKQDDQKDIKMLEDNITKIKKVTYCHISKKQNLYIWRKEYMFNYATIICSFTPKEKKTAISDDVVPLRNYWNYSSKLFCIESKKMLRGVTCTKFLAPN